MGCLDEVYFFVVKIFRMLFAYCAPRNAKVTIEDVISRFGSWDDNDPEANKSKQIPSGRRRLVSSESIESNQGYYILPSPRSEIKVGNTASAHDNASDETQGKASEGDVNTAGLGINRPHTSSLDMIVPRMRNYSADLNRGRTVSIEGPPRARTSSIGTDGGRMRRSNGDGRRSTITLIAASAAKRLTYQTLVLEVKGDHIKDLFWMSNPNLYFEVVRFFIMLLALYISLWLVSFSSAHVSSGLIVAAILPGIFGAINYLYVVKTAALLKAMYNLDFEAAHEVLEQTDGSRALQKRIREAMHKKISPSDDQELRTMVFEVFNEIDTSGNGTISRREFSVFLTNLGIALNRKQWKETFRMIDVDASDSISYQELFVFLYPDNAVAIKSEKKRLQTIRHRVDNNLQGSFNHLPYLARSPRSSTTTSAVASDSAAMTVSPRPLSEDAHSESLSRKRESGKNGGEGSGRSSLDFKDADPGDRENNLRPLSLRQSMPKQTSSRVGPMPSIAGCASSSSSSSSSSSDSEGSAVDCIHPHNNRNNDVSASTAMESVTPKGEINMAADGW